MKSLFILFFILCGCTFEKPGTWNLIQCNYYKCQVDMNFQTKDGCDGAMSAGNKASEIAVANSRFSCSEIK